MYENVHAPKTFTCYSFLGIIKARVDIFPVNSVLLWIKSLDSQYFLLP